MKLKENLATEPAGSAGMPILREPLRKRKHVAWHGFVGHGFVVSHRFVTGF